MDDRMISGRTEIIAHLGFPTETFTAPMIYNPWFAHHGIHAVVVPMGVRATDYAAFLRPLFWLSNIRGALVILLRQEIAGSDVTVGATLREHFLGETGHERGPAGTVYGPRRGAGRGDRACRSGGAVA